MDYWAGPARLVNAVLLFIVGFLAFDLFFLVLRAQDGNFIVGFVNAVAGVFLAPFQGMFSWQSEWLTSIFAILGYILLAGIVLAVIRAIQLSRHEAAARAERNRAERRGLVPDRPLESVEDQTQRL